MLNKFKKPLIFYILAVFLYITTIFIGKEYFDVHFTLRYLYLDFIIYIFFTYIIYTITQRIYKFILLELLFITILIFSNFLKISFYGAPIFIDDILLVKEIFHILNGFYFFLLIIFVLLSIFILFYNRTNLIIRPFDGLNIVKDKKHIIKCIKNSIEAICLKSNRWIKNIKTLSRDLFIGEQHIKDITH